MSICACPSILRPIFAFRESYFYKVTEDTDITGPNFTSYFSSILERLTPTCKYTLFNGPIFESENVTVILGGNEVIYAKLPDYIYQVNYKIQNGVAKFWRVSSQDNVATQVLDVNGQLVENLSGK